MITPTHHYQVQQVLKAFGAKHLATDESQPLAQLKALKYKLGPVLANNEAEQAQLYILFDKYIEDIAHVEPPKKAEEVPFEAEESGTSKEIAGKILRGILVLSVLGLSALAIPSIINIFKAKVPPVTRTKGNFQMLQKEIKIGDTLKVNNLTQHDTSRTVHYDWEIFDKTTKDTEHKSQDHDLVHPIHLVEKGKHEKTVRMIANDTMELEHFHRDTSVENFTIVCRNKPLKLTIQTNIIGGIAEKDTPIQFSFDAPENSVQYEWDFGNGTNKQLGAQLEHTYLEEGVYEVQVIASKDTFGFCETLLTTTISVGKEQAPLTFKTPLADNVTPSITFNPWLWWLLGVLGLLTVLSWVFSYWQDKKAKAERVEAAKEKAIADQQQAQEKLKASFAAPDKAPYSIPYENNNGLIRMAADTYRMADILRARQEGLRKELDVPTTVQQTIEKGGFPAVAFRYSTLPAEYLFLLDEKESNSHQKRLFQFLTDFLRDKDIHIEVFWYRGSMQHLWNQQQPKGIELAGLRRLYPHHKLVVMGNGHDLLHPYGGTDLLLPEYASLIREWKNRVLLTPQPSASWTYREEAIADLLLPFPADMQGLKTALPYLDMDEEALQEQVPDFDQWTALHQKEESLPDVNYKKWRKLGDYQNYLQDHPSLYRWVCALAVHPRPTWELTIAIGRALENEDHPLVTYDNLLILSHIPWLQGQDLSPKLRKILLEELQQLDPTAEAIARKSVLLELKNPKVAKKVEKSHANFEWQSEQIFQQFGLNPANVANNRKLHALVGKISRRQRMALDQSLERYNQEMGANNPDYIPTDLTEFLDQSLALADNEEGEKPNEKTPWAWWHYLALGTTIFTLINLLLLSYWNGSDQLYQLVKGKAPEPIICDSLNNLEVLPAYFFTQNCAESSTAIKWNNHAVNIWQGGEFSLDNINATTYRRFKAARDTFQLAIEVANNKEYPLAKHNLDKLHYNLGTAFYESYFKDGQQDSVLLDSAFVHFWQLEQSDSIQLDGWHALGLVHFYQKDKITANIYSRKISDLDEKWFDNLETFPHLAHLLDTIPTITSSSLVDSLLETIKNRNIEGDCRKIANVNYSLSLRNSRLSQAQFNQLNRNANNLANTNLITRIPLDAEVQLLDSVDNFYAVKYEGQVGWVVKLNKGLSTLNACNKNPNPIKFYTANLKGTVKSRDNQLLANTVVQVNYESSANQKPAFQGETTKDGTFSIEMQLAEVAIDTLYVSFNKEDYSKKTLRYVIKNKIVPSIEINLSPINENSESFTDPRDKQTYKTTTIGKQTWFAQNLNYQTKDSWCYLELDEFCQKAGRLYTWETAKTACPKGWHLPSDAEWKTLLDNFGGEGTQAYQALIEGGNNNFAALLGGFRGSNGEFIGLSKYGYYWSAAEQDADDAWLYGFGSGTGGVDRLGVDKTGGLSCRCLKD